MRHFKDYISLSDQHACLAVIFSALKRHPETIVDEEKLFTYLEKRDLFKNMPIPFCEVWRGVAYFYQFMRDDALFLDISISMIPKKLTSLLIEIIVIIYPTRYFYDGFIEVIDQKLEQTFLSNLPLLKQKILHDLHKPVVVRYSDDSY